MTTTNEPTRTGRPSPSPASSSTVAIVLAVIAALVGFFIIKQVRDDGNSGGGGSPSPSSTQSTATTIDSGSLPTVTGGGGLPTQTTGITVAGSSVQVANASSQNGVAGQLTTALAAQKFTMAAPGNGKTKTDTTHVYYDPANTAAKPVADSVASLMGIAASEPMPSPIPTKDGTLPQGCGVLVLLGTDKAGKPLTGMGGSATTAASGSGTTSTSAG
jgi:hypothetical protein